MISVKKFHDGYTMEATPPHSHEIVSIVHSVSIDELIKVANEYHIHAQDFWDAVVEADPSVAAGR